MSATQQYPQETITGLKHDLIAQDVPIEKKFRSLFTLRGIATKEAIDAMASGMCDSLLIIIEVVITYLSSS